MEQQKKRQLDMQQIKVAEPQPKPLNVAFKTYRIGSCFTWNVKVKSDSPERQVRINTPDSDIINNKIETTKYTYITFIPKNLFEQFQKFSNLYFLILGFLSMIKAISNTDGFPAVFIPLAFIMFTTAAKDFYEDQQRRKSDNIENKTIVERLSQHDCKFVRVAQQSLLIGDVIKVHNNGYFPADCILLSSSDSANKVYVETKNLDGETNMKQKSVVESLAKKIKSIGDMRFSQYQFDTFNYEKPNPFLYQFKGTYRPQDGNIQVVDYKQMALRGSQLKNTDYCICLVVYTGRETKIMLNSQKPRHKTSNLIKQLNICLLVILLTQVLVSMAQAIGYVIFKNTKQAELVYLMINEQENEALQFFIKFGNYFLMNSYFVPISLLVTMDVVKLGQGVFIRYDDRFKSKLHDIPTEVRNSQLNEELGQVQHVFSDKTGTLTQNIMEFKQIDVKGTLYGRDQKKDDKYKSVDKVDFNDKEFMEILEKQDMNDEGYQMIRDYLMHLSLCHTIMTNEKDGQMVYNATSPDEYALIQMAYYCGFIYKGIDDNNVMTVLDQRQERTYQYKLLDVLEFNSTRKRMSVIIQNCEDQSIHLYSKGADNIIMKRMDQKSMDNYAKTDQNLEKFSSVGYRTLLLVKKKLEQQEYDNWKKSLEDAQKDLEQMEEKTQQCYEEIEKGLELVGATAIEDKLQEDVGDTIAYIKRAGIKVWVLTGDKQETAINIGFSCKLLDNGLVQVVINAKNEEEVKKQINTILEQLQKQSKQSMSQRNNTNFSSLQNNDRNYSMMSNNNVNINTENFDESVKIVDVDADSQLEKMDTNLQVKFALILSGDSLVYIQSDEMKRQIYEIACKCEVVLACRVSPKQKADIVNLVKHNDSKCITLSIGDGANDVNMINAAHVGVGIKGVEGNQAARASDYSMGEFKFLRRLLLAKGREFYRINSFIIQFNFWKNILLVMPYFWFGFHSLFTGYQLYVDVVVQQFNVFLTNFSVTFYGLNDEEYKQEELIISPHLYNYGRQGKYFNYKTISYTVFNSILYSIVLYYGFVYSLTVPYNSEGQVESLSYVSTQFLFTIVVFVNTKILIQSNSYCLAQFLLYLLSNFLYYILFLFATLFVSYDIYFGSRDSNFPVQLWVVIVLLICYSVVFDSVNNKFYYFIEQSYNAKQGKKEKLSNYKMVQQRNRMQQIMTQVHQYSKVKKLYDSSKFKESVEKMRQNSVKMKKIEEMIADLGEDQCIFRKVDVLDKGFAFSVEDKDDELRKKRIQMMEQQNSRE